MKKILIVILLFILPANIFAENYNKVSIVGPVVRRVGYDNNSLNDYKIIVTLHNGHDKDIVDSCFVPHLLNIRGEEIFSRYSQSIPYQLCSDEVIPSGESKRFVLGILREYRAVAVRVEVDHIFTLLEADIEETPLDPYHWE